MALRHGGNRMTPARETKIRELRAAGHSVRQIAREIGIPSSTVGRYLVVNEVPDPVHVRGDDGRVQRTASDIRRLSTNEMLVKAFEDAAGQGLDVEDIVAVLNHWESNRDG